MSEQSRAAWFWSVRELLTSIAPITLAIAIMTFVSQAMMARMAEHSMRLERIEVMLREQHDQTNRRLTEIEQRLARLESNPAIRAWDGVTGPAIRGSGSER